MTDDSVDSLFSVLRVGATIVGLGGPAPVKILSVDRLTDDSAAVAYRNEVGALAEKIVYSESIAFLRSVKPGGAFTFDGQPEAFLLAAEAR